MSSSTEHGSATEHGDPSGVSDDAGRAPSIVVVPSTTADRAPAGEMTRPVDSGSDNSGDFPESGVGQPAKVMRIGTMIKQLLDEVRSAPLDEAARTRLATVHERSVRELEEGLSPELLAELHRITLPFPENSTPSDAELRIAQAQLVGWLEGLFHGLQTALVAQQLASQAQLAQMRRSLPSGSGDSAEYGPDAGPTGDDIRPTPGQYL